MKHHPECTAETAVDPLDYIKFFDLNANLCKFCNQWLYFEPGSNFLTHEHAEYCELRNTLKYNCHPDCTYNKKGKRKMSNDIEIKYTKPEPITFAEFIRRAKRGGAKHFSSHHFNRKKNGDLYVVCYLVTEEPFAAQFAGTNIGSIINHSIPGERDILVIPCTETGEPIEQDGEWKKLQDIPLEKDVEIRCMTSGATLFGRVIQEVDSDDRVCVEPMNCSVGQVEYYNKDMEAREVSLTVTVTPL